MKTSRDDQLAMDVLAFAFTGRRFMPPHQHRQVRQAIRQARAANYESGGKRRSRLWGFGPAWAKRYG